MFSARVNMDVASSNSSLTRVLPEKNPAYIFYVSAATRPLKAAVKSVEVCIFSFVLS